MGAVRIRISFEHTPEKQAKRKPSGAMSEKKKSKISRNKSWLAVKERLEYAAYLARLLNNLKERKQDQVL